MQHLLMSCPQFPMYRAETHMLDVCPVVYGSLRSDANFQQFADEWKRSKQFLRSNLSAAQLDAAWTSVPRRYTALLGAFMQAIARDQDKQRWIEKTPAHVASIRELHREFSDARILHMIRDPRDVALSRERLGWVAELRGQDAKLLATCLDWASMIRRARRSGAALGDQYLEIRYEDLVTAPRKTFELVCNFVEVPFNEASLTQMRPSNTAFGSQQSGAVNKGVSQTAVQRWKTLLGEPQLRAIDLAIGPLLDQVGYPRGTEDASSASGHWGTRALIVGLKARAAAREFLKHRTPLRRLSKATLDMPNEAE